MDASGPYTWRAGRQLQDQSQGGQRCSGEPTRQPPADAAPPLQAHVAAKRHRQHPRRGLAGAAAGDSIPITCQQGNRQQGGPPRWGRPAPPQARASCPVPPCSWGRLRVKARRLALAPPPHATAVPAVAAGMDWLPPPAQHCAMGGTQARPAVLVRASRRLTGNPRPHHGAQRSSSWRP